VNWYEKNAKHFRENHSEQVKELQRLFKEGNDIKRLSEYMGWSQWTIAELLEEK